MELETEVYQLLDALAELIQQVERAGARGTPAARQELVKAHEADTRQLMEALSSAIHTLLNTQPSADQVERVYAAVTSRARAWSRTSPVFHRIFHTPRHQLDPYEVSELLLDNQSRGADIAGEMLDRFYLHMDAAQSFRLRTKQLARTLVTETQRRVTMRRPVRLLNLHTGMGRELDALVQDRALRDKVHLTCLDTDAAALRRTRVRLGSQLGSCADFQLGDPRKVLASRSWPNAPYDIIYALILFDQLSDRQVWPLIANCYRGLRPGGILVFGNFATDMSANEHLIIHWVMNFNIRRRSEETLRSIFARTPFGAHAMSCELNPLGASWLVVAGRV